jgi:signal peptidase I
MLWLGKWPLALIYLFAIIIIIGLFFVLPASGVTPPIMMPGLELADYALILFVLFGALGFLHAMVLRKRALNRPWYSRWYVVFVVWPLLALTLLQMVRAFGFQTFDIPGNSMAPNLISGDYFIVSKSAYGYGRFSFPLGIAKFDGRTGSKLPRRGVIAVFKLPADTNTDYVKRVIGLPGDRVRFVGGVLYLNGKAAYKDRISVENPSEYVETLPDGVSYRILDEVDGSAGDDTNEYLVPPAHYFMLGDNRDNSEDSRFLTPVGYVPVENFLGPVVCVYWNSMGVPINSRPR